MIIRQHTYNNVGAGTYTVTVRGFNMVNNDTETFEINVEVPELTCQPPNITIYAPSDTSVENKNRFTVGATFDVDCAKNERFTSLWELMDSDQTVLMTLTNATQLTTERYTLPAGSYIITITASLWSSQYNLSDMTVVATICFDVTLSALVPGIEFVQGNSNPAFNDTIIMSAYNVTYDSSIQSRTDKTGMTPEWRCKRSSEAWPDVMPNQPYQPYDGVSGGCFGNVGPGVLGFAAGQWDLNIDTGYLEPLIEYDIQFVVTKDVRLANASVSIYVQQPLAPVVELRLAIVLWCY